MLIAIESIKALQRMMEKLGGVSSIKIHFCE